MTRSEEISELLRLSPDDLVDRTNGRLTVVDDLDDLHRDFAERMAEQIETNNENGERTVWILPYGPVPQYDLFVDFVNERSISLRHCTFFFMDEYCDQNGTVIPRSHPLSFRGAMDGYLSRIDDALAVPDEQVIFPTEDNLYQLREMIEAAGGVDTCYGGIGIHGHVAFNEPEPNVRWTDPRLVYLNDFTVTINAVRAGVGGNVHNFPSKALTLGMSQVMNADKIRLYCRSGNNNLDWAKTVLRLAALGASGDDYPVTYVNDHADWEVVTDRETVARPEHIIDFL